MSKKSPVPETKVNFIVSPHAMEWPDLTVVPGIEKEDAKKLKHNGVKKPKDLLAGLDKTCAGEKAKFCEWLTEKLGKTYTKGVQEETEYRALEEWPRSNEIFRIINSTQ